MKLQKILGVLLVLLSLWPAWQINRWLQRAVQPRRSFLQFLLYLMLCFALVFAYTFLVSLVVLKLFPPPR